MTGDVLLAGGGFTAAFDLLRAGLFGLDLWLVDLGNGISRGMLGGVDIAATVHLLGTNRGRIGDGLKTPLHGPSICSDFWDGPGAGILTG